MPKWGQGAILHRARLRVLAALLSPGHLVLAKEASELFLHAILHTDLGAC